MAFVRKIVPQQADMGPIKRRGEIGHVSVITQMARRRFRYTNLIVEIAIRWGRGEVDLHIVDVVPVRGAVPIVVPRHEPCAVRKDGYRRMACLQRVGP